MYEPALTIPKRIAGGVLTPIPTPIRASKGAAKAATFSSALGKHAPKRMTSLRLPSGERDLDAIRTVIGEWLVPLLVEEFLAEYEASTANAEVDAGQFATKQRGTRK